MHRRSLVTVIGVLGMTTGLLAGVVAGTGGTAAGAATARATIQSPSPAASAANLVAATPAGTSIDFSVGLQLQDPAGARALLASVSDPKSPSYRHFLSTAAFEARFSPTAASVQAVTSWLRSQGVTVDGVTPDRMTVQATASAAVVARVFGTSLGEYRVNGQTLRMASSALSVPASLAHIVLGVEGIDEIPATHPDTTGAPAAPAGSATSAANSADSAANQASAPATAIPQPPGFRNPPLCSQWYGARADTVDPHYGDGFPSVLSYTPCGYTPAQEQGAYGLRGRIAGGDDGSGVTVAVVDAYASPTLYADAHTYSVRNQPAEVLSPSQFSEQLPKSYNETQLCQASGWFGEQTLDVEAVHAMAPGAHILYVGAKNCLSPLFGAVQSIVDHDSAQIITDSWGDDMGDLFDPPSIRAMFDNVLVMAGDTGIGVQFSAGDYGDDYSISGLTAADYPPSSPYQTAVGGTTLQVGPNDRRTGEFGWSTSRSVLCTSVLASLGYPGCTSSAVGTYLPPAPGAYDYGGGGGVSYEYPEPSYQVGVVPTVLADRNASITGIANRVEPDISMDADPSTGFLIGETQAFPNGTYYDQYRIGGTSLASPLLAGLLADADQAARGSLGFVNPALYALDRSHNGALYDVVQGGRQAMDRVDYVNEINSQDGLLISVRTETFQGFETYCPATGPCKSQQVTLHTGQYFDSMTGLGSPGANLIPTLGSS